MEKQREIVRLWLAGKQLREIMAEVKVSNTFTSNVVSTARAIGMDGPKFTKGPPPSLSPDQVKSLIEDRASGLSFGKLAEKYGVSNPTIMRTLRRHGVK